MQHALLTRKCLPAAQAHLVQAQAAALAAAANALAMVDQAAPRVMAAHSRAAMVASEAARMVAHTVALTEAHMAATGADMVPTLMVIRILMDLHTVDMDTPTIATTLTSSPDLLSDSNQPATRAPPTAAVEADISLVDSGAMALTLETSRPASATWVEA